VGLELVPADKRGVPFVPTQEIFRLPLNDGEIRMLTEIFQVAQSQNPEWVKNPLVDRLFTKIAFLYLLGKVMFLPPDKCKAELDGVLKMHGILTQQVLDFKKLEEAQRAAATKPPPAAPKAGGG